jgi:mRNA interferase MazF
MGKQIKRGDIYYADLSPCVGSEQGGCRPVIVVQNDVGNKYSPTVIVTPITSQPRINHMPTHVQIPRIHGLESDSIALIEQIRTLDRHRLTEYIGRIGEKLMLEINQALAVCIGIEKQHRPKGEAFDLCLCKRCKDNFRDSGYLVVRQGWQKFKSDCDFCTQGKGFVFGILDMSMDTN